MQLIDIRSSLLRRVRLAAGFFRGLLPELFSLNFCPVIDPLLFARSQPGLGMKEQILPDRHLSVAYLRADSGKKIDLALDAVVLPLRQIEMLAALLYIAFEEPRDGCEPAVCGVMCAI